MFSGFSEDKDLWGLLSLAGSQDLPYVNLILYLANHFHHHRHHTITTSTTTIVIIMNIRTRLLTAQCRKMSIQSFFIHSFIVT